jgi:RNA-directed DNA polymerase
MFDNFISLKYIHNSFLVAYRGRNKTKEVILYKQNLEENLNNFQKRLINFTYKHRKYNTFIVEDSKKRVINAPNFEDHILHHSVFFLLEDIFEKKFIENSFANRKNKGSHKAVLKLQRKSKKYNWYLKLDIIKYFQSVDQEILFEQIKRYVKDENFLFYVKMILESYIETNIINPLTNKPTGMPIGNVTSQLFANIYLHDLDFYVENSIKPKYRKENKDIFYIRYVDDFVFLGENKEDLLEIQKQVLNFLQNKLKLLVSPKKLILNRINCGIPFLGYVIWKNKIKIRNDTIRKFKTKVKDYSIEKKVNSLISFKGHCDLANQNLIYSISNSVLDNSLINEKTNKNQFLKNYLLFRDNKII